MKLRSLVLGLSFMFVACGGGQHSFAPLDSPDAATDATPASDAPVAPIAQDATAVDGTADVVVDAVPSVDAAVDIAIDATIPVGDAAAPTDSAPDGADAN